MSEMLANQYFMARNYLAASQVMDSFLESHPNNKSIQKKLIICYTQIGKIEKAFDLFYKLIKADVDFIINTDPVSDDCPCPELILATENKIKFIDDLYTQNKILGLLWLYCDLNKSVQYFENTLEQAPSDLTIISILKILHSKQREENNSNNKFSQYPS